MGGTTNHSQRRGLLLALHYIVVFWSTILWQQPSENNLCFSHHWPLTLLDISVHIFSAIWAKIQNGDALMHASPWHVCGPQSTTKTVVLTTIAAIAPSFGRHSCWISIWSTTLPALISLLETTPQPNNGLHASNAVCSCLGSSKQQQKNNGFSWHPPWTHPVDPRKSQGIGR